MAIAHLLPNWLVLRLRPRVHRLRLALSRLSGKTVVHILHIRKTGGTAIKEALGNNLITASHVIELHTHEFTLDHVPKSDRVIFFVRDPVARFVSGFYSRKREGRPRYYFPWNDVEKKVFEKFDTPNQLALGLSSDDPEEREAVGHAINGIRHLGWRLEKWLVSPDLLRSRLPDILLIGFQESLEEDFENLKQIVGLDESVQLPRDDVKAHRNRPDSDRRLDEQARTNLVEWYADDYEFFELCREHALGIKQASLPQGTKFR